MSRVMRKPETATEIDQELETIRKEVAAQEDDLAEVSARERADYARSMGEKASKFEHHFRLFLAVYAKICELNRRWRGMVFRGDEPFSPETDTAVRSLFAVWCLLSDPIREKAEYYERHGASFPSAFHDLANFTREARQTYRTWESPALSSAPALRTLTVAKDDVEWARSLFPR